MSFPKQQGSTITIKYCLANSSLRQKISSVISRQSILKFSGLFALRTGTVLLGIINSILWTRFVDQEVYGQYKLILSIIAVVSGFCLPGLAEAVMISAAKRYDGNVRRLLTIKIAVAVCGSIAICGAGFYYRIEQAVLFVPFLVAALFFPLHELTPMLNSWLNGRGMVNLLFLIQVLSALTWTILFSILLYCGFRSLSSLIFGSLFVSALFALLLVLYIFRKRENSKTDSTSIKYGFHTSLAYVFGTLVVTDKIIINAHFSAKEVAVYSVALIFPEQIRMLYAVINQLIIPNIYKAKSVTEGWAYLRSKIAFLYLSFVSIGIVGFIVFPIIIPLLFSQRYAAAVPYGKWLWLSLSLAAPATYLGNILRSQQIKMFVYVFSICQPILLFCMYNFFISWGIKGIVISRIIFHQSAAFMLICFFFYYLSKERKASCAKT